MAKVDEAIEQIKRAHHTARHIMQLRVDAGDGTVKHCDASTYTRLAGNLYRELDAFLAKIDGPSCPYCGTTEGLRVTEPDDAPGGPDYICEACWTPKDEGPCFDDLPEAAP